MHVACPACGAAYEVPDRLIGPAGRQLRCAKCGHAWLARSAAAADPTAAADPPPAAPAPIPAPAPVSAPAPAADRDFQMPTPPPTAASRRLPQIIDPPLPQLDDKPPPPAMALWTAWVASILLVVLGAVALWIFRADLVAAWPPMARLYLALGIEAGGD